jgi:hypothetical protein
MNIKSPPLVRALPSNQKGRDFVVGDLHGCFDLLDRLLEIVRFDPANDRLFSVGDLVDRCPDSFRCISFLGSPWFHAVEGNHEYITRGEGIRTNATQRPQAAAASRILWKLGCGRCLQSSQRINGAATYAYEKDQ